MSLLLIQMVVEKDEIMIWYCASYHFSKLLFQWMIYWPSSLLLRLGGITVKLKEIVKFEQIVLNLFRVIIYVRVESPYDDS